nr:MAG TPA: hypothetical protein [Caudoviricetes sp.]
MFFGSSRKFQGVLFPPTQRLPCGPYFRAQKAAQRYLKSPKTPT